MKVQAFDKFGALVPGVDLGNCRPCRMAGLGNLGNLGEVPPMPIKQDLVAAVTAFTIPFAYDRYALKKHKRRYGRWANAGAVVGIYLTTSLLYRKFAS